MNKTDIVQFMQKRTLHLTLLSIILVGLMTIYLIPTLFEEANAVIIGQAFAPPGTFFNDITYKMGSGKMTETPKTILGGTIMVWKTDSTGLFGGLEQGTVFATVRQGEDIIGPVSFSFSNPITGSNSSQGAPNQGTLKVTCYIPSSGASMTATFDVSYRNQESNGYCDIIKNIGGLDQSKLIREKLPLLKCK